MLVDKFRPHSSSTFPAFDSIILDHHTLKWSID
jgi:hypothetical protein